MSMHVYQKQKNIRGFTLVETLVYLAVTVLIAGAGVTTYLTLDTVFVRNATERALTNAATVVLERMVRDIRSADSVNTGASSLGTSPGVLVLVADATTTTFSLSGGDVVVRVNGGSSAPLTSDSVTVNELTFTSYTGTTTELVRIKLSLSANSKAASTTRTYYSSAVLRGTYE